MRNELTWKIGGQQGEGIESAGDMLANAVSRSGYHIYSYRQFSSRIKGGHTSSTVRVSLAPVRALTEHLDILVAFDQETIALHAGELDETGLIITDSFVSPILPEGCTATLLTVPLFEFAKQKGLIQSKNMAAVGAVGRILGLSLERLQTMVKDLLGRKGEEVTQVNLAILTQGFESISGEFGLLTRYQLASTDDKQRMIMTGNDAIALGALAGGVRLMAAYPISPASDIMEYLVRKLPEFGGVVVQTEDEIAACTMAIGANYAGVRAFTASSGPGLSLMAESIGLSGMTETPLVIVNVQRGGPSTGLPTKHEQSDLLSMIYGPHGEVPKIVMAPSTVSEAFYDTAEACNLAEEYQCPVILLSDLQLSLSRQTVDPLCSNKIHIRRGKYNPRQELPVLERPAYFARYAITPDGVSMRSVPGMKNGMHCETGLEHDQNGRPAEASTGRIEQMNKRLGKLQELAEHFPQPVYIDATETEVDLLVIGFGGTRGAIEEAVLQLRGEGVHVSHAQIRLLEPLPVRELECLFATAHKCVVVENNATGQLSALLRMKTGVQFASILKYDGSTFLPSEVYARCKEMI